MAIRPGVGGVIFQSKKGYDNWNKGYYCYKLKPIELTKTDFFIYPRVKKENEIGNLFELVYNIKSRTRKEQEIDYLINYNLKSLPNDKYWKILFDVPFFNNAYYVETDDENWNNLIVETAYIDGKKNQ